jgi:hypothetical protein
MNRAMFERNGSSVLSQEGAAGWQYLCGSSTVLPDVLVMMRIIWYSDLT